MRLAPLTNLACLIVVHRYTRWRCDKALAITALAPIHS